MEDVSVRWKMLVEGGTMSRGNRREVNSEGRREEGTGGSN